MACQAWTVGFIPLERLQTKQLKHAEINFAY